MDGHKPYLADNLEDAEYFLTVSNPLQKIVLAYLTKRFMRWVQKAQYCQLSQLVMYSESWEDLKRGCVWRRIWCVD